MERGPGSEPAAAPTPEQVLRWIAASAETWFPGRYATASGVPRDTLDPPLNELRAAELVRVVDWVRGLGQGYALTPDGEAAVRGKPRPPEPSAPPVAVPAPEPVVAEQPPIVTPALVYANLLWYFVGLVIVSRQGRSLKAFLLEGDGEVLIRLGAVRAPELLAGEWWRLATCCFVHGTIWHLLVNVASLVMVGAVAEHLWGRSRTFIIYLVSGFAGSCLAMGLRPLDPTGHFPLLLVGASGALCGLALAVLAWVLLRYRQLDRDVAVDLLRRLGFGIMLSLAVSLLPGVSWEAHLGGAVAGFAAAVLVHVIHIRSGWQRAVAIVLVAMMPAACMGGLLLAIRHSAVWQPFRAAAPPQVLPDPQPHLDAIQPEKVKPAVFAATSLLMTDPKKWKPERVKDVRDDVSALWNHAVEASRMLAEPSGDPVLDAKRARVKVFADLRVKSLGLLLGMIDGKAMPKVEAWQEWGKQNGAANRLWGELTQPQ